MTDVFTMIGVMLAGFVLGVFFFGGLYWTVDRGLMSRHPAFWFTASWLARIAAVVTTFILVSAGRWERTAICTTGFLIARIMLIQLLRSKSNEKKKGGDDAAKSR